MEKAHLEVILENMDSKFNLVLEGHESLRREMRGIRDELVEKIDTNSFKIEVLNQKIDAVAADLKATDERLSGKIDAVAADLKATDERLSNKIASVETNLSNKIDAVAADLKAHRADTEAHHGVYRVKEG